MSTIERAAPQNAGPAASGLRARIEAAYPHLTPSERRVADAMLDRAGDVGHLTSGEVADAASVSKATVSRFARVLGFESFASARAAARLDARALRAQGVPVLGAGGAVHSPEAALLGDDDVTGHAGVWSERLAQEIDNLRRAFASLAAVPQVATGLASARTIVVLGFRNGWPLAMHARTQLAQAHPDVRLAPQPGQSLGEELADLSAGDAVLCVGVRRRPRSFESVAAVLAASSATTVLLAEPGARRHAEGFDHVIEAPIEAPGPFDSHGAATAVVAALADAVAASRPDAGARVARVNAAYEALDELERP